MLLPIEWCSMTAAEPGDIGPTQVPISPLSACAAITRSDSKRLER